MPRKAKENLENQVEEKKKNSKIAVTKSKSVARKNDVKSVKEAKISTKKVPAISKVKKTTNKKSNNIVKVENVTKSKKVATAAKAKSSSSTTKIKTTTKKPISKKDSNKIIETNIKQPAKKVATKAKTKTASVAKKSANKKTATKKAETSVKKPVKKVATKAKTKTTSVAKKSTNKKTATKKAETSVKKPVKKAATKSKAKTTSVAKKSTNKKTKTIVKKASSKKDSSIATPEYYDLPYHYNQTIVKVLAQTPKTLFVYWDVSSVDAENLINQYGKDFFNNTIPFLRVHNKSNDTTFDVDVDDFANGWYIHVDSPMTDYYIELLRKQRPFVDRIIDYPVYITSSNNIETPNDHIIFDENMHTVFFKNVKTGEIYAKDISMSLLKRIGKIYNIYDWYKRIYKSEDVDELFDLNNPSSGNPSSTFK